MGGLLFTMATKEAGLRIVHLDWNNNKAIYVFVFAVKDWEGRSFVHPNQASKFSSTLGKVLAVLTHVLAYFSASVTSGHKVIVLRR
ncbi:hypothetical protein CY34DRAFT_93588 [Suillus luteus UH-Slu-Lm8-n1]|uniref:Uncharacterized protein n=1 Tax=Suillus luteus UH-Slu-Lm8-n1 TaxID=930992 RepID=A0A0D0AYJ0_9AGAM|nr:hypothetical protein CY34DRAFT_93588 [Suillus luteus UH-Slu-Lm8-n1]